VLGYAERKNSSLSLLWKQSCCCQKFKGLAAVEVLWLLSKIQRFCCFVVRYAERKNSKALLLWKHSYYCQKFNGFAAS